MAGDVPKHIGRIGKAMQQHRGAHRLALRRQNVRAVPVVREMAWIDLGAIEIAIALYPVVGFDPCIDMLAHRFEQSVFVLDELAPRHLVQLPGMQLIGQIGMPQLKRRALLHRVQPHAQKRYRHDGNNKTQYLQNLLQGPSHRRRQCGTPPP